MTYQELIIYILDPRNNFTFPDELPLTQENLVDEAVKLLVNKARTSEEEIALQDKPFAVEKFNTGLRRKFGFLQRLNTRIDTLTAQILRAGAARKITSLSRAIGIDRQPLAIKNQLEQDLREKIDELGFDIDENGNFVNK
tara:strand:+ start:271 stop:690 length:420 start_codon:yes stop_codon:yes gene_type:complete